MFPVPTPARFDIIICNNGVVVFVSWFSSLWSGIYTSSTLLDTHQSSAICREMFHIKLKPTAASTTATWSNKNPGLDN